MLNGGYKSSNQCMKKVAMDKTKVIPKRKLSYEELEELRKRISELPEITIEPPE